MNGKTLAKIFYTQVRNPEEIEEIELSENGDLREIENFIKSVTKQNKNAKLYDYDKQDVKKLIGNIVNKRPNVTKEDCETFFFSLSKSLNTRSKENPKYFALIVTKDFVFIYQFSPMKGVTFEKGGIKTFVKHLDKSTLLRFILVAPREKMLSYVDDRASYENEYKESEMLLYVYEKKYTKGFNELIHGEPVYDYKGDLKIRSEITQNMDLVLETNISGLYIPNSAVNLDFDKMRMNVSLKDIQIKEFRILGKKYPGDLGYKEEIENTIELTKLGVDKFINNYRFHTKSSQGELEETLRSLKLKTGNIEKQIEKPEELFKNKETIFIFGLRETNHENLIEEIKERIKNNLNISFVELTYPKFGNTYRMLDIGDFSLFARFDINEWQNLVSTTETLNKIIQAIKSENMPNLDMVKTLSYIALKLASNYLKSGNLKKIIGEVCAKAFADLFSQKPRIEERDELGIELKTGIIKRNNKEEGFYKNNPQKFAEEIFENFNSKGKKLVIYFIGITEDTKEYSPIPLNYIRNETLIKIRKHLEDKELKVHLIESIPVNDKQGVLLLVIEKKDEK